MSDGLLIVVELLAIIVCCGVLPAIGLHFLMKAFAKRPAFLVKNYAGRLVPVGLGFVWPLWGVGLIGLYPLYAWSKIRSGAFFTPMSFPPFRLMLLCAIASGAVFAFGLIDDLGGTGISKGFKGHLRALAHGKLTTGAVKLFGIGATALLFAYVFLPSWYTSTGLFGFGTELANWSITRWLLTILLLGGSIALSANFVNLCDLRPGRASKVTIVMFIVGALLIVFNILSQYLELCYIEVPAAYSFVAQNAFFALFILLPILATLRFDLREQGMLGDAGANPAGFIAGAFIAIQLGWVGLIVFFLIMLALNLASEKFSFSRVIERNPLLSRLDRIGRMNRGQNDTDKENAD